MPENRNQEAEYLTPKLSDVVDISILQDIQDWFARFTGISGAIRDPDGFLITQPSMRNAFCSIIAEEGHGSEYCRVSNQEAAKIAAETGKPTKYICHAGLTQFTAPIVVDGETLGLIVVGDRPVEALSASKIQEIAERLHIDKTVLQKAASELRTWSEDEMRDAIQFLYSIANTIASICYQGYQLQKRINELYSLRMISGMLIASPGLQEVLDVIVESATRLLDVKGCAINLIDEEENKLYVKAFYNVEESCLEERVALVANRSFIQQVMNGDVVIAEDITEIPCPLESSEAETKERCSILSAGLISKDKAIGTIHAYVCEHHEFTEEQIALFRAIANQAVIAIEGAKLYEASLEKHRMEQELSLASEVQYQLLPHECPKIKGFEIAADCIFCRYGIGGDFYDFIPISKRYLGIVIADVVGKGVPSAILMAEARAALRAQVENIQHPDEIIERVNRTLYRDTRPTEFVTMVYCRLDINQKTLAYTNAGHNLPVLVRDGELTLLEKGGTILGFLEDVEYEEERLQLMPGDLLFLYTDGITEVKSISGDEQFGEERLHRILQENARMGANEIKEKVLQEIHNFVGGEPLDDDLTMLVVKVLN
ncbi:GAF domain-containing protein [Candidatus Poribacteria bacterium]|nr:GAF domain-containing protein [Candidatus Poribacteria bacterium]